MDLARKHYPALTGYLERLETAYQSSTPPDPIEDIDHMEAIIKGLNIGKRPRVDVLAAESAG
ncbi:hypothetical protein [Ralstonia pseudosolanacearum]|uniref:hypothetical protein n=1 Tax=Ralstonia pseudosolanacearum TaxID=1310165 RepID=UPI0029FF1FEE|nr:hypothetical protein [Ralstonia sp. RS642]